MRCWLLCALTVWVVAIGVCSSEVVVLTQNNFDDLTESGPWLLDFYAPWCTHCKELEPVFNEVAKTVGDKINMGKIDCTEYSGLQKRFNVTGFPTLIFRRDGESRVYRGERSKEALLDFIESVSGPAVTSVGTERLKEMTKGTSVVFAFFGSSGPEFRVYEQVARRFQGLMPFVHSSNSDLVARHAGSSPPAVVVFADGDSARYTGAFDADELRAWVTERQFPLLSELSPTNFAQLSTRGLLVFCITDPSKPGSSTYQDACRNIAKQYRGKFTFAHMDGLKYDKYLSQFGLTPANYPLMLVFDFAAEQFYHPEADKPMRTTQDATAFLDSVYEGRIKPTSIGAWWSPARLFRWFEKWISQFSDVQLIIGSLVVCMVLSAIIFFVCCGPDTGHENEQFYAKGQAEYENEELDQERKQDREQSETVVQSADKMAAVARAARASGEASPASASGGGVRQRGSKKEERRRGGGGGKPASNRVVEDDDSGDEK